MNEDLKKGTLTSFPSREPKRTIIKNFNPSSEKVVSVGEVEEVELPLAYHYGKDAKNINPYIKYIEVLEVNQSRLVPTKAISSIYSYFSHKRNKGETDFTVVARAEKGAEGFHRVFRIKPEEAHLYKRKYSKRGA